jgi:hypothetical protein
MNRSKSGPNKENVKKVYTSASLVDISADRFWLQVCQDPQLEDLYLSINRISEGLRAFLVTANEMKIPVWMLSKDVDRGPGSYVVSKVQ